MRTLPIKNLFIQVVAAIALTACATSANFARPPSDAIQLGKTTRREVIERFGTPSEVRTMRVKDRLLQVFIYKYSSEEEAAKVPGTLGSRQIEFLLSGDFVVGEAFASSFASDDTDFDERKAQDIVKAKTRCDEVVAMLGRPSMTFVYPGTPERGEKLIAYVFKYEKRAGLQADTFEKDLMVRCDPTGVVAEVHYSEEGKR
jgi:outer membrane protein assembly factor BamE (lipoprotein component of BamABCDE complex)